MDTFDEDSAVVELPMPTRVIADRTIWVTQEELAHYGLAPDKAYSVKVEPGDLEEGITQLHIEGTRARFRLWGINTMGIHPHMTVGLEVEQPSAQANAFEGWALAAK